MNTIFLIAIIAAAASPILADESAIETKKQDKRGLLGLGYGGYYSGLGYSGLGYGGYGHLGSPLITSHAGFLPTTYSHSPIVTSGYHGSIYNTPYRLGYNGLGLGHGLALGQGLNYNYLHGGHIY